MGVNLKRLSDLGIARARRGSGGSGGSGSGSDIAGGFRFVGRGSGGSGSDIAGGFRCAGRGSGGSGGSGSGSDIAGGFRFVGRGSGGSGRSDDKSGRFRFAGRGGRSDDKSGRLRLVGRGGLAGEFARAAALCLVLALALAGCGQGASGETTTAPTAAAPTSGDAAAPAAGQQGSAPSGEAPAGEKILRMATNFESTTFDPTLWGNANGSIAGSSMYETLLTLDGDKKVASKLAESWDVSDDYRTCVFKLRKGVQFHHGYGELTAEDVVFTIERMSDPELGSLTASLLGVDNFESVSAPDAYTVEIRMKEADPGILIDFASWYSMIVSKKAVEELTPAQFGQNPVGTGPVEFVSGRIAEQYMVRRFEDYWGEGAALDGIQISTLPDETNAINAFEAGELDLISLDESTNIVKYMDDNEVTLINAPSFNVYFLGMNLQVEPFDDARVRHAISLAINRDELIEDYWQNTQLPTTSFVPNLCLYAVTDAWTPEYNVERAKELLAEAGYPDGFSTTVAAVNDTMSQGPMAVIQQYLAEIGVDLKMNASEYGTFITDVREGQQPMWFMARSSDFTVDRWLSSFLSSEYPGNNWGGYQDEEFDMLLHEAQIATEEDEKEALYRAAQLRLIEMMPAAPIAQTCSTTLMKKNVSGFERDASGYMLLYKMSLG